eukprot:31045-Pelagococcus_subviridis.AAC.3
MHGVRDPRADVAKHRDVVRAVQQPRPRHDAVRRVRVERRALDLHRHRRAVDAGRERVRLARRRDHLRVDAGVVLQVPAPAPALARSPLSLRLAEPDRGGHLAPFHRQRDDIVLERHLRDEVAVRQRVRAVPRVSSYPAAVVQAHVGAALVPQYRREQRPEGALPASRVPRRQRGQTQSFAVLVKRQRVLASVGVERRRGRGLKARGRRRETTGKVLKDRRPPRERGRMGTSV